MWPKSYKDYKIDEPLVKNKLYPGRGITGCEMHDLNGWGNQLHRPLRIKKKGLIRRLIDYFKKPKTEPTALDSDDK